MYICSYDYCIYFSTQTFILKVQISVLKNFKNVNNILIIRIGYGAYKNINELLTATSQYTN